MNDYIMRREDRITEMNRLKTGDAHNAMRRILARPVDGKDWCVCRFVQSSAPEWPHTKGPPTHGWPLHSISGFGSSGVADYLGGLGWHESAPIAFFTEEEARRVATHSPSPIAYDRAVHVSQIRWTVRLYSHYDGSEATQETDSYDEALVWFSVFRAAVAAGNTLTVAYLKAGLDGRCPVPADALPAHVAGELPRGARGVDEPDDENRGISMRPPLTQAQYAMLVAANGCSLPGDGLRIKGAGQHRVAECLYRLGYVRVAIPPEGRSRVHITQAGRIARERIGQTLLAPKDKGDEISACECGGDNRFVGRCSGWTGWRGRLAQDEPMSFEGARTLAIARLKATIKDHDQLRARMTQRLIELEEEACPS